jgi:MFS family permease
VSSVVPLVYSLAGRSGTMLPGMAIAAVSSIGFLGFLLGPPLIGFIAEASNLRWSFGVIAVLGLGTTVLAGGLKVKE